MAILNRLSRHEIRTRFTHWGLLLGVVPIYAGLVITGVFEDGAVEYEFDIRDEESNFPQMQEANGVPRFIYYLATMLFGAWMYSAMAMGWKIPAPIVIVNELRED